MPTFIFSIIFGAFNVCLDNYVLFLDFGRFGPPYFCVSEGL